jgi:glutathione synthase/RimK-type ligase-like ATP-grasp enzyme
MILIISSAHDVHAQAVLGELGRRGARVRLLDLSDFPMRMSMTGRFDNTGHHDFELVLADGGRARMSEVTAVWWRRPQAFGVPGAVGGAARQFAYAEAATAFQGMWQSSRARWVNDVVRDAAAAHKPWQLSVAKGVGLTIPETLITNCPKEARAFWAGRPGEVVYKAFSASYQAWRETRVLRPGEEALAEAVRLAPVIFQRYVPAVADLRVTVVGERVMAAEADARGGEYAVDVRFNTGVTYRPHALPVEVERKLLALVRRMGLEYGAIDLRLTPEGEYVFLEINPAGQFLYVEQAAGIPIAAAVAEHLAGAVGAESRRAG